jgi:hypothetical protein
MQHDLVPEICDASAWRDNLLQNADQPFVMEPDPVERADESVADADFGPCPRPVLSGCDGYVRS